MSMKCSGCTQQFRSLSGFDKHRIGSFAKSKRQKSTRRCMADSEMLAAGMAANDKGVWSFKWLDKTSDAA